MQKKNMKVFFVGIKVEVSRTAARLKNQKELSTKY